MNALMDNTLQKQPFGLSKFLTVLVICAAIVAAAVLWNRSHAMTSVQLEGWASVAPPYRDSVERVLRTALQHGTLGNLRTAEEHAESFPFVQSAIARKIGSTVHVTVIERIPRALLLHADGSTYWLAEDGSMLPYQPYFQHCSVPIVYSHDTATARLALQIIGYLQQRPEVEAACSEIHISSGGVQLLLSPYPCRVLLGSSDDLESKTHRLAWILRTPWIRKAVSLDLRWKERIIVSTHRSATTAEPAT